MLDDPSPSTWPSEDLSLVAHNIKPTDRGTLPHIHDLPVEILLHILLTFLHTEGRMWCWGPPHYYLLVTQLSQVCRRWGTVLDECPAVWAEIYPPGVRGPETVDKALLHSANTPVRVRYRAILCSNMSLNAFLAKAMPHIKRWQCVKIQAPDLTHFAALASAPAPLLIDLDLDVSHAEPSITVDLFGGYAPLLKTLKIRDLSIRWDSSIIQGLRSLHLAHWKLDIHPPSHAQILHMLHASPSLVNLFLNFEVPVPSEVVPSNHLSPIPLSGLTSLHIALRPVDVLAHILNSLICPNCAQISVEDRDGSALPPNPSLIHHFLRRSFTANHSPGSLLEINLNVHRVSISSPGGLCTSLTIAGFNIAQVIVWLEDKIKPWPTHITIGASLDLTLEDIVPLLLPFKRVYRLTLYPGYVSCHLLQHLPKHDALLPNLAELYLRADPFQEERLPLERLLQLARTRMTAQPSPVAKADAKAVLLKLWISGEGWGVDQGGLAKIEDIAGEGSVNWIPVDPRIIPEPTFEEYWGDF